MEVDKKSPDKLLLNILMKADVCQDRNGIFKNN
jgi:hypothetical protein